MNRRQDRIIFSVLHPSTVGLCVFINVGIFLNIIYGLHNAYGYGCICFVFQLLEKAAKNFAFQETVIDNSTTVNTFFVTVNV